MNDTYTVTIRDAACDAALKRLAEAQMRSPEQQLNWLAEQTLKQHAKFADKPARALGRPRAQSAAA